MWWGSSCESTTVIFQCQATTRVDTWIFRGDSRDSSYIIRLNNIQLIYISHFDSNSWNRRWLFKKSRENELSLLISFNWLIFRKTFNFFSFFSLPLFKINKEQRRLKCSIGIFETLIFCLIKIHFVQSEPIIGTAVRGRVLKSERI